MYDKFEFLVYKKSSFTKRQLVKELFKRFHGKYGGYYTYITLEGSFLHW